MSEQVASLKFQDLDEKCEGYAATKFEDGQVVLVLSLQVDGDIQICVKPSDARAIAEALEVAADRAEGKQ